MVRIRLFYDLDSVARVIYERKFVSLPCYYYLVDYLGRSVFGGMVDLAAEKALSLPYFFRRLIFVFFLFFRGLGSANDP